MLIVKKGLDVHRERVPENLIPFHEHMQQRYNEMKSLLEREYNLKVNAFSVYGFLTTLVGNEMKSLLESNLKVILLFSLFILF